MNETNQRKEVNEMERTITRPEGVVGAVATQEWVDSLSLKDYMIYTEEVKIMVAEKTVHYWAQVAPPKIRRQDTEAKRIIAAATRRLEQIREQFGA